MPSLASLVESPGASELFVHVYAFSDAPVPKREMVEG